MRIKMLPLILPMITILSIGSCKTTNRNSSLASAELVLAVNAVAKEIEEKFWIQTLVADTHFYHWAPRANVTKNVIPSAADAQNYVRAIIDSFWFSKSGRLQSMGDGFYLAASPLATTAYGTPDWVLLQAVIPTGTRMIDIDFGDEKIKEKFSKETIEAVSKFKSCGIVNVFQVMQGEECIDLSRAVLDKIKVFAISYNYEGGQFAGCLRPDQSRAIVVRGKDVIKPLSIVTFTKNSIENETTAHFQNRLIINDMFKRNELQSHLPNGDRTPWMSLDSESFPPEFKMTEWIQKNLWGCAGENKPMLQRAK